MKSAIICTDQQMYDQIKDDEMGLAYGRDDKCVVREIGFVGRGLDSSGSG
jgi:hypothetical protein